ncbi:hypothetical protein [Rhodococcus sp. NPDC059234]|uniref:hypothetical protein n=1 Tax=Rhodococcus sp. NPDC059234 TaxID=3346781 RepID=UPI00366B987F
MTFAFVGGLAGVSLWSAPPPIVAPWDTLILLDGGYRITEGQAPSTDFSNPIGPLLYGLVAIGMRFQRVPSLAAVTYGSLIFLALAAPLAWFVARSRVPAMYAAAFTGFVALVVVSVRPLGYSPSTTAYAMLYNRFGWVLYATVLLAVLCRPRRQPTARGLVVQGAVLGVLLGLLFYCKFNFFVAAVGAAVIGFALSTTSRRVRFWIAAAGGFVAIAIAMRLAFNVRTGAYVADLGDATRAQGAQHRLHMLTSSVADNLPVALLVVVSLAALFVVARRRGSAMSPVWRVSVAAVYVACSSVVVSSTNSQERSELPALVIVPMLLVAFLALGLPRWAGGGIRAHDSARIPLALSAALAVLFVATAGPIAGHDASGIAHSAALREYVAEPPQTQQFHSERLHDFVIPADSQWPTAYRTAHVVPEMINDGFALLVRHVGPGDTVVTMALTDPFSFALSLPSSRGGLLWWDLGFNFDESAHPGADQVLGDTQWVMVPRIVAGQGCCEESVQVMLDLYGPYLAQHFTEAERTSDWILLGRAK